MQSNYHRPVLFYVLFAGCSFVGGGLRELAELLSGNSIWTIMGINLVGSFALAFLSLHFAGHWHWPKWQVQLVTVGLIGSFTTFSTFGVTTVTLWQQHNQVTALVYVTLSMVGGVLAALAGYRLADAQLRAQGGNK